MTKQINGLQAVIFDNDGCLQSHNSDLGFGDTEKHYYAAFEAIACVFGKHLPPDSDLRRKVMGIDIRDVGKLMIEGLGLPAHYDEWKECLDRILLALAPFAAFGDGGRELVHRLVREGVRFGVASSSTSAVLEAKWRRYPEERACMGCFVAGDDPRVKRSKPAPDLVLVAACVLGVNPRSVVYVGDSHSDIVAATNARAHSVLIRTGGRPSSYYEWTNASVVVQTFAELSSRICLEHEDGTFSLDVS